MEIKIQQLRPGLHLPERQTPGAVGYDLYLPESVIIPAGRSIIPVGFAIELPEAVIGYINGRSGYNAKGFEGYEVVAFKEQPDPEALLAQFKEHGVLPRRFDIDLVIGEIDPDYRGEVGVVVKNNEVHPVLLAGGTRIAQMNFIPCLLPSLQLSDTLSSTSRGEGGFGHTNDPSPAAPAADEKK